MTLPALIFAFIISTLYGVAFHLWAGGGAGRLLLYLLMSWLGFAGGQALATWLGWGLLTIGPLHVGLATAGSALFLFVGHWLSLVPERANR
jgi:hypothetical protein